ncbi:MAG: heavy metal-binding domain-containing protein [Candidatus Ranarchaeia archaeon]
MGKDENEQSDVPQLLLTTNETIPGYEITKVIGLVYGVTVRTRGIGGKFLAGLRGIVGGEMGSFVELANELRTQALNKLNSSAYNRGANAVIGVRYDSNDMSTGDQFSGTEVCAYGTAVIVRKTT